MKIGDYIKLLRKRHNVTQVQLAAISKVSQSNISKIESNSKSVTLSDCKAMLEALGMTLKIVRKK